MRFQKKIDELNQFIDRWSQEVRNEFNIGEISPAVIRSALEPASPIVKIKDTHRVTPGYYQSLDMTLQIHVLSQDMETGLIVFEMLNDVLDDKYQTMSPGIFFATFQPGDANNYSRGELIDALKSTSSASEAAVKEHTKHREASFSWTAINTAYGKMAERYMELYDSVTKENVSALKADYLEFLFLAFVLGNRLGFSPRNNFHALYSGVFSLTDGTWEECQSTMSYYNSLLVDVAYEKIELYDPTFEMAKPLTYYLTFSTKDQVGTDKLTYPKNCFLSSRQLASRLAGA